MPVLDALSELQDAGSEKPWCDLVMEVVDCETVNGIPGFSDAPAIVGRAVGAVKDLTVGVGFVVPTESWHPSSDPRPPIFYWSQVVLKSLGAETDNLVRLYEQWFELPITASKAVPEIRCSAVALEDGKPAPLDRKTAMKIFFESPVAGNQDDIEVPYAELFFKLDVPGRRLHLHEKDVEYRKELVVYFTGEAVSVPSVVL